MSDPLPLLTSTSSSTVSSLPDDEEVLAGSVDQLPPLSSKRSRKASTDTEEILNFLKTGNEHMQKTLELIYSTFAASTPSLKRSRCLWKEASVKDINPSLWRSFQHQSNRMITHYLNQSALIQQAADEQSQQHQEYVLTYDPTTGTSSQVSNSPLLLG